MRRSIIKNYKDGKQIFCTSHICSNHECVYKKPKQSPFLKFKNAAIFKPFLNCKKFK